ncbi:MAG: LysR family transcriptional regulator [Sphingomonas sp.]|jgi:DNA-binding transcriptional LysR family regulator|nr:LysR family transcriptional regulator [Sphingomonas sp.]
MDIKWLEDFVSLARTRSFSRSAEDRHVTQSAFSRRIQALETWLGVSLVDRSRYPTTLTPEGRQFRETAEETLRQLHNSKINLRTGSGQARPSIAFAALHSIALTFFPKWFREIEGRVNRIDSRLLPDDFHNCLQAIVEGDYDFLLLYHHSDVPIPLDPDLFPHIIVGMDSLVAVRSPALDLEEQMPLLSYSHNSFLGRLASSAQVRTAMPSPIRGHVNENAMAEALKFMAIEGHGIAWLPRSLAEREIREGTLVEEGPALPLEIRLYRKAEHKRAAVEAFWLAATDHGDEFMRDANNLDEASIGPGTV